MSHRLVIAGAAACFSRPGFSSHLVTCDVIPPIAARSIFEAIHWTPAIRWQVERIDVLSPIRAHWVERSGGQKALELLDVSYLIRARFELTASARPRDNVAQHANIFRTRAKRGQFYRKPYLGRRDLPASIRLIERGEELVSCHSGAGEVDLGWMPYDRDHVGDHRLLFYRPRMVNGAIDLSLIDPAALPS